MKVDDVESIGVVGTGVLGKQITSFLIRSGHSVILKSRSLEHAERASQDIFRKLGSTEDKLGKLSITDDYHDLSGCNIIIESVVEDMNVKIEVLKNIDKVLGDQAFIGSNTSTLSIDTLSKDLSNRDRFLGVHFFNPVHKMRLVEVIRGQDTSSDTIRKVVDWVKSIDRVPVVASNSPGFIVNFLLFPQLNSAVKMMERGVSTKEDIDTSLKLGLNHPLGPFELIDLIGIDVCVLILNQIADSLQDDSLRPASALVEMNEKGLLGRKVGKGFYKYI